MAAILLAAPLVAGVLVAFGVDFDEVTIFLIPLPPVVTGVVAVAVAARASGSSVRMLFGGGRLRIRWLLAAAAIGVGSFVVFNIGFGSAVVFVLELLGLETPEVQSTLRDAATRPETVWVVAASTIIAAPLGEELLYRGLLFQSLLRRFGAAGAIWLSAAAFGIGHITIGAPWLSNVVLALLIFPLGAVLAWSFWRSKTLWVPIVIHSVFNSVTVTLMASGFV